MVAGDRIQIKKQPSDEAKVMNTIRIPQADYRLRSMPERERRSRMPQEGEVARFIDEAARTHTHTVAHLHNELDERRAVGHAAVLRHAAGLPCRKGQDQKFKSNLEPHLVSVSRHTWPSLLSTLVTFAECRRSRRCGSSHAPASGRKSDYTQSHSEKGKTG